MGHWYLRFETNGLVTWDHSDVQEMLPYGVDRHHQISAGEINIAGSYHVATDRVFWGGLWYEPIEPLPRPRP